MKNLFFKAAIVLFGLSSCGNDDDNGSNCFTCNISLSNQSTEICEGDNGNAFIAGGDTQQNYNDYLDNLRDSDVCD